MQHVCAWLSECSMCVRGCRPSAAYGGLSSCNSSLVEGPSVPHCCLAYHTSVYSTELWLCSDLVQQTLLSAQKHHGAGSAWYHRLWQALLASRLFQGSRHRLICVLPGLQPCLYCLDRSPVCTACTAGMCVLLDRSHVCTARVAVSHAGQLHLVDVVILTEFGMCVP